MSKNSSSSELGARLEKLKNESDGTINITDIEGLLNDTIGALNKPMPSVDPRFYRELESVAEYIHKTRDEIAALRPDTVKEEYLQTAADELDAIVEATAEATHTIMDAAEMIEDVTGSVSEDTKQKLNDAAAKIYEACTFQDITGQRITKVVNALKGIEEKIDGLLAAFGPDTSVTTPTETKKKKKKELTDEDLLNGPQLKDKAKTQDEIDALFDSLD
ncbi:MAG: protein phosphatase CheZ [Rhodospirillaceae bacterium]